MGTTPSTKSNAKKDVTVTDSSTKIQENSSGFHFMELHIPSMGVSLGFLGLIILTFYAYHWQHRLYYTPVLHSISFSLSSVSSPVLSSLCAE
jgi:hypothetical protein